MSRRRSIRWLGLGLAILVLALIGAVTWLRIGFPSENAGWVNWIAGPVEQLEWGGEGLATGTLELQLLPPYGPCWIRTPVAHLSRVATTGLAPVVEYPIVDRLGRARLLHVPAGDYVLARGGGAESVDLEEVRLSVEAGKTTRVTLGR